MGMNLLKLSFIRVISDFPFFFNIYLCIWLCRICSCGIGTLSCNMWDLVPRLGIEPQAPCIGSMESSPLEHWENPFLFL